MSNEYKTQEELILALEKEIENKIAALRFSSPKIKGSHFGRKNTIEDTFVEYSNVNEEVSPVPPIDMGVIDDIKQLQSDKLSMGSIDAEAQEVDDTSTNKATPVLDYANMTPKEFKKHKKLEKQEQKKAQKEQEYEAKKAQQEAQEEKERFDEARREAHKRGYDTTILTQLEDFDEVFELSNEDIDRIEAVGHINKDGFYDFKFPPDAHDIKRQGLSTKRMLLIGATVLVLIGFIALFFRNAFTLF